MTSTIAFEPQALVAPLNPVGQQSLASLIQAQTARKRLATLLKDASDKLTAVAGQLNDRGTEVQLKHTKQVGRLQANGEEPDEEALAANEDFQAKVKDLTKKMDHGIRSIIDAQNWLDDIPDALKLVSKEAGATNESTQLQTQGPTPLATARNRSGTEDGSEINGEIEQGGKNETRVSPPDPSHTPIALLRSAFKEQAENWKSKSLTERYASSNEYTGFYKIVHDAKNPGENAPLIPHRSLWFAEEENSNNSTVSRSQTKKGLPADDEDDSDLEIAAERISIKCPITFLPFKNPVTSTKCPHSFEKEAIFEMIRMSTNFLPMTEEQRMELDQLPNERARERRLRQIGTPAVKCPVCSCLLAETDLKPDPVLLRKVQRVEALAKRREDMVSEDEDEEDEDDDAGLTVGTQRKPLGLGSSPPRRISGKLKEVKKERARSRSMIPQTQLTSTSQPIRSTRRRALIDSDEEEEEEEAVDEVDEVNEGNEDEDENEDEEMYDSS